MSDLRIAQGLGAGWTPSVTEKIGGVDQLIGRICPSWRMLPGLVALASCVVGIACAIMWKIEMLCIAFAPGAASSIYFIYLGWSFKDLKTFAESNEELRISLGTLKEENEKLQGQLQSLQGKLEEIEKIRGELQATSEEFRIENAELHVTNAKLKDNVEKFESLNDLLSVRVDTQVEQLQGLHYSLEGIEKSAQEDHTLFAQNLLLFIEQVKLLQTSREQFEKVENAVEIKMNQQIEVLLGAVTMLQSIFTKIEKWKDNAEIEQRIIAQQMLQKNCSALELQVHKLELQFAKTSGQMEEQERQLKEFDRIRGEFNQALDFLLNQVKSLESVSGSLGTNLAKSEEILKAVEVFRGHRFLKVGV